MYDLAALAIAAACFAFAFLLLYVLGRSFGLRLWHKYLRRLFSDVRAPVRGLLR